MTLEEQIDKLVDDIDKNIVYAAESGLDFRNAVVRKYTRKMIKSKILAFVEDFVI